MEKEDKTKKAYIDRERRQNQKEPILMEKEGKTKKNLY
jgi:hypothetical protein